MNNQLNQSESTNPVIKNSQHHKLTPQQIAYLTARIQGKNKEESKRFAKYSENTSTYVIENNPNMRLALLECFKERGITEHFLADKLMKGMSATKKHFVTFEGEITDERDIDDGDLQFKYFSKALEVRQDVRPDGSGNINIGVITVPSGVTVDEWNQELNKDQSNKLIDNSDGKSASILTEK